jgi:hypothetical protein
MARTASAELVKTIGTASLAKLELLSRTLL